MKSECVVFVIFSFGNGGTPRMLANVLSMVETPGIRRIVYLYNNKPKHTIDYKLDPNIKVYSYSYNGNTTLWIMDIDGSNDRQLITHFGFKATWSPDGNHILYCKDIGNWTGTINIIDKDGNGDRVLKRPIGLALGQHHMTGGAEKLYTFHPIHILGITDYT